MKYKLVIFDFDGTLTDSFPFFLDTVNELADLHKFRRLDMADVETLRRHSARNMINHLGLPLWKVPFVGRSFKAIMAGKSHQVALFAGVENMLHALSAKGLVLSLVTSNSHENVRQILSPKNLDLMVHQQCGTSLFGKPSRLRKILRQTGIHRSETIYIGDELRDLEAAHSEKIHFGAVSWGYTSAEALIERSPAEIFSCMDEIVKKIAPYLEPPATEFMGK